MNAVMTRLKYTFLALFALSCVGVWAYQVLYANPEARCEGSGGWWSSEQRICGVPVRLSRLTGRPDRPRPAAPAVTPAR